MVRIDRFLAALLISLLYLGSMAGCVSGGINWDSAGYTVRKGDTLYSIAWRYEIDHGDLAKWNHLSSPYIIHPGDRLRTHRADNERVNIKPALVENQRVEKQNKAGSTHQRGERQITVRQGDTLYSLAKKHYMPAWKLAMINGLKQPYVMHPGQTLSLESKVVASNSSYKRKVQPSSIKVSKASVVWRWPVRGKIVGKFNRWKNDAKGIDIAGKRGASIRAAAAGKVVYSGNSLINYGHLVIIKHSQDYLSAYANNRKLLVSEGEKVAAGQKIAELGSVEPGSPRLHFEIRKKGKPVDPLHYLPRR